MNVQYIREIPTEWPPVCALNYRYGKKVIDFRPISRFTSQTIQDSAIVTIVGGHETTSKLSNDRAYQFEWRKITFNPYFKVSELHTYTFIDNKGSTGFWHVAIVIYTSNSFKNSNHKKHYRCPQRIVCAAYTSDLLAIAKFIVLFS